MSDLRVPAEVFHPSELIRDEMDSRDWGIPTMARKMGGDAGVNRLALEMYFVVGPQNPGCRLGPVMAAQIAKAFGTSIEVWTNLEAAWLSHPTTQAKSEEGVA